MPYPNEYACRLHPPGRYDEFARVSRDTHDTHKSYDVIRGKKSDGTWEDQAFRYPKQRWDADEARAHCNRHDGTFEATQPQANEGGMVFHRNVITSPITIPLREEIFEGRRHLVVPVVALVEGVHYGKGAPGPVFYPAEEIGKYVEAWNGVPVPVFHPEVNGQSVLANSPQIIEERSVGRFFNSYFDEDGGKLKGEIWIDIEKAQRIEPEILTTINSGGRLEVSTALWSDDDFVAGTWNGEEYVTTARNYRPESIALLPGDQGACSWEDGCGVRINSLNKGGKSEMKLNIRQTARMPSFEGTETISWADVSTGFTDYRDAYYRTHGGKPDEVPNRVQDAPAALKAWIASKTLLGDGNADTIQDLIFFPVVNPRTNKLNEGALRAVISGRGTQADIPAQAKSSAQRKARQLLNQHFGAELDVEEKSWSERAKSKIQSLVQQINSVLGLKTNEISHDEVRMAIQRLIDSMDNVSWIHFLKEVYDDSFIYEARSNNPSEVEAPGGRSKLYQRGYSVDAEGNITFKDDVKEVREERKYVPVANEPASKGNTETEKAKKEEVKNMEKNELIKTLIECDTTKFEQEDEEWLKNLSVEQLEKLKPADPPPAPTTPKSTPAPAPTVNQPATKPEPKKPVTVEEYVANAPFEVKSVLTRAIDRDKQVKEQLVKGILANANNPFTEERLNEKEIGELEQLATLARIEVDFSAQGGTPSKVNDNPIPPMPPSFVPATAEK